MTNFPTHAPFVLPVQIEPGDIDELGHVNNAVYFRWVQQVAIAHWRELASPEIQEKVFWVVVRHEIDYLKSGMPNDTLVAHTWVGLFQKLRFERFTKVVRASDGEPLVQVRTLWVPIDPKSQRILRQLPEEVRRIAAVGEGVASESDNAGWLPKD
jgi:acyl-CoA thioester hydrolase